MWRYFCMVFLATVLSSAVAIGGPAAAAGAPGQDKVDVIVGFDGPPNAAMVRKAGGQVRREFTIVDAVAATMPAQAAEALAKAPGVRYVEPDHPVHAHRIFETEVEPSATVTESAEPYVPWGVERVFVYAESFIPENPNPEFWNNTVYMGDRAGIGVAVLDTGIWYSHPDLRDNLRGFYDAFDGIEDYSCWEVDLGGHGTHVAGTIAANLVKLPYSEDPCGYTPDESGDFCPTAGDDGAVSDAGIVGVSPNADLYAVKVLDEFGSGTVSSIIAGIEWAIDSGLIDVINMSLGTSSYSQSLEVACDKAYSAGILLVASAGNSGNRPGRGDNVEYPASFGSVIAVAASDINDQRASFSSTGPDVELIAPGVDILSTWADGCAIHQTKNGTSMAAPHVTGVAALAWSTKPGLTNAQIRQILKDTAEPLGLAFDHQGHGLVRADLAIEAAMMTPEPGYGSISGTVSDAEGGAIAGAEVVLHTVVSTTAITDGDGRYWFADVLDGTYTLTASAAGYAESSLTTTVESGSGEELDFVLAPVGSIGGTVRDASVSEVTGGAIDGATVVLQTTGLPAVTTGLDGTYQFDKAPVGTYGVTVSAEGYEPFTSANVEVIRGGSIQLDFALSPVVTPPSGASTANVAIEFQLVANRHLSITLTVTDEGHAPIIGAQVTAEVSVDGGQSRVLSGDTSDAGVVVFRWNNVPSGPPYEITVLSVEKDGQSFEVATSTDG